MNKTKFPRLKLLSPDRALFNIAISNDRKDLPEATIETQEPNRYNFDVLRDIFLSVASIHKGTKNDTIWDKVTNIYNKKHCDANKLSRYTE